MASVGSRANRMPLYEYRCRTCDEHFELRRPMRDADLDATCPGGHRDAARLLPAFAVTRGAAGPAECGAGSGSCCGGRCAPG